MTLDILIAEDDQDDQDILQRAFSKASPDRKLKFVSDGEALLNFLFNPDCEILPKVIILDLNMPKIDGREALKLIKTNVRLKKTAVIVLTTSNNRQDISHCYELGANAFLIKPSSMLELIKIIKNLDQFWFDNVTLP